MNKLPTLADVEALDRLDPLAPKRAEFNLPDDLIYLDGNSLGAMPLIASQRAREVVEREWGQDLIRSWNQHDWINLPSRVGGKIGKLIGAAPGQTICCDSTSVNLYKLLTCALGMQKGRTGILTQQDNFPADLYIAAGVKDSIGGQGCEVITVQEGELLERIDTTIAVLLLTHVNYRTAAVHDMEQLTARAHENGVLVIWDLSHSVGALPLALDQWQVDFAVGCGYKYLNGGPGAPAFIYAASRHHAAMRQPLQGWMGHKSPFEFAPDYIAASGVAQFLCGTPAVISMSVLEAALQVFDGVDMESVRRKSQELSELFLLLVTRSEALQKLRLKSPLAPEKRGSHLAFTHPQAYAICQALIAQNVICDFRAPATLRIGFAPMYVSFRNVWDAVSRLGQLMEDKTYLHAEFTQRRLVT